MSEITLPGQAGDSLRDIDFPPTDRLLRDDVKRLGALVGEILAEQVGADFLAEVERIRRAAIARREAGAAVDALAAELAAAPLTHAEALVRAFATYFQAVNLAERVHRIRRRRDYQKADAGPQPGGLHAVLAGLHAEGVTAEEVFALLPRLCIEPVFTAHPTEAVRRALLEKEQAIVRALVEDIDRGLTPQERRAGIERIRMALTAAWQTAETAPEKPSVADEFEHVAFYLSDVLYRVLPVFHEVFADALRTQFGEPGALPPLLRFGSWVGGDMDGNPNVGADTIAATLASQRALVLAAYRRDLAKLGTLLTQSLSRVEVAPALLARIDDYRRRLPKAAARLKPRHADMPYRTLLALMSARLAATAKGRPEGYADAGEFLADLYLIRDSLHAHRGERAGEFAVRRVICRAETFGFHLATLDLRQDSAVHDAALAALLADPDYPTRSVSERLARLRPLLDGRPDVAAPAADDAASTLAVFRTVADALPRYGARAFGPYIVSMSRSAADALAVLALARVAGCVDGDGRVPLDVAPLFETVDDLDAAESVLRSLFADPHYRAHLAARGDRQVVMLGYSDSAKDGGIVASRWSLQRTQLALTALAKEAGVRIAFFHGRGGSVSRGGGKTERAVIAAPRGSVDGSLRVTEQGEVIHRKYGIRAIALRNLEQTTGAVLRATLRPRPPEPREARWREIVSSLADTARARYRGLVYATPDFPDYFRAATPIDVIERLRIGSRPSKRAGHHAPSTELRTGPSTELRTGPSTELRTGPSTELRTGIERLRAIPWVFAWSQNRAGFTAWYGVGTALAEGIACHGRDTLAEMARDWPFFAALLDDVEMVLAKSDLAIFERYSRLAGPLHARFFPDLADEFVRTRDAILALKGSDELLAHDRRLRLSIRLRNPYVDPISLLQVELLRRWREGGREDDCLLRALFATVNGIAAGIQNTG
ncbi:phosphoenolpyruvate carboxylase [Rehaibacterium terrae]|uniref:Phosphoenolpyruvate carboxylase n=1 Tax=Rehaibacterium terrae TaxID=1341696 RepID=A0A7W7XXW9_9GAMM|nr:phosphoenolpyruvate carboxylase [Rehaibacterium terrae]MBB5014691.1 phosphoenolpyruvate carboxylase [Rehaibacterium terrae]